MLSDCSHVAVAFGMWKALFQHSATIGVNLNLPYSSDSSAFKAKVKSSYSGK